MLEILIKGQWMMIPLVACSVLAIAVLIDRAVAFWHNRRIDTRSLRAKVLSLLEEGKVDEAAQLCASTPGPVSAVILTGLKAYAKHKSAKRPEAVTTVMEKAMEDYSHHALAAVEKRLPVLTTVGSAAPLMGMTGTVTGMIGAFGTMQEMGGVDAAAVAGGISEALITTAAGLIVALIAVIPATFFNTQADRIALEIDEASTELLDFVATRVENA